MGDLIRMPGVEVDRPQRRGRPWPDMVLASLIVGIGMSVLIVLPGVVLTLLLELGRVASSLVSAACAAPLVAWSVITMKRINPERAEPPPEGFHDAGENCDACGGPVWTPDDERGPPHAA